MRNIKTVTQKLAGQLSYSSASTVSLWLSKRRLLWLEEPTGVAE